MFTCTKSKIPTFWDKLGEKFWSNRGAAAWFKESPLEIFFRYSTLKIIAAP